jgi:cell division protein FtsQ
LGLGRKKQNRFKRRPGRNTARVFHAALKFLTGGVGAALLSVAFVFCHDVVTQCRAFEAREVTVTGIDRLGRAEVCRQAGIRTGSNILAVNLTAAHKRLLAHPWIADARIRREMPDAVHIVIRERRAMAVIDLGRKFLIDDAGTLFKEAAPRETARLPVVEGLRYADIDPQASLVRTGPETGPASGRSDGDRYPASALGAVVSVLRLGTSPASVIPNGDLKRIRVDGDYGITLQTRRDPKTVVLGFGNYAVKYDLLRRLLDHLALQRPGDWRQLETVYLNNLNRIVVRPLTAASGDGEPAHTADGRDPKISNRSSAATSLPT